jgi:cation diffusion facilitator family transporter
MQNSDIPPWQHAHDFLGETARAERNTRWVIALTAAMMVAEIIAGLSFGSMALLADGWHMSTHVAAFLITAFAYWYARRHAADRRFTFGTGKVGVLGGFTSAIVLAVVALLMAAESIERMFSPQPIVFNQAIAVASLGLAVNLASAALLHDSHDHHHGHGGHDHHSHHHGHGDQNLRAAYLHVLADALTSVTAIVALLAGKYAGWNWLDPAMGIVGSVVIALWARGLLRDTSRVLLDGEVAPHAESEIREAIEADGRACITDLHVWQVGPGKFAVIVAVVADEPRAPEHYRALVQQHEEFAHVTVEVHRKPAGPAVAAA